MMWLVLVCVGLSGVTAHRHSALLSVHRRAYGNPPASCSGDDGRRGLRIIRNFNNTVVDHNWPVGRAFAPPPLPDRIAGGGNLSAIFNVAADYWEYVFRHVSPPWTVQVDYGWVADLGGLYGQERLITQGGCKHAHT